jgi:hypothetical protein
MTFRLTYGTQQRFKHRHGDINIVGRVEQIDYPVKASTYTLNGGEPVYFYVEEVPDPGIDWTYEYKDSPAINRLKDKGDFNVEIPITAPELREGDNTVLLRVLDASEDEQTVEVDFSWDPEPVALPIDLTDLSAYTHIQEVGQIVDGAFDLDRDMNLIRSRAPVYVDSLFLIGSPHGAQEATYHVRFLDLTKVKWLGPSDFFVEHVGPTPSIGIKPGWSTCGMAALNPRWEARSFLAYGDHSGTHKEWVVRTAPPNRFIAEADLLYSVRHQVFWKDGVNHVRYRIWPEADDEPEGWLCWENDASVPPEKPRFTAGSFGLFQHSGMPIEWSNIRVRGLDATAVE